MHYIFRHRNRYKAFLSSSMFELIPCKLKLDQILCVWIGIVKTWKVFHNHVHWYEQKSHFPIRFNAQSQRDIYLNRSPDGKIDHWPLYMFICERGQYYSKLCIVTFISHARGLHYYSNWHNVVSPFYLSSLGSDFPGHRINLTCMTHGSSELM
jgi:hypothetical protein